MTEVSQWGRAELYLQKSSEKERRGLERRGEFLPKGQTGTKAQETALQPGTSLTLLAAM